MAGDNESYSWLRLDRSENEYPEEMEDLFDVEAVRLFRDASHRRLGDFDRQRDADFQRLGNTNLWNNIDSLMRHEGHSIDTESQDNFNSTQNTEGYFGRVGYRAISQHLVGNGNFEQRATSTIKSVVAALKFKKIEGENEVFFCAICQDLVNVGETGKELPCMHNYHADCIHSWLARRNTCPICRFEFPTGDHDHKRDGR